MSSSISRNYETFGKEYRTIEMNMFVTTREDKIKLLSSGFSPFLIWLTKKAFAVKKGFEIVTFTPWFYKPLVS